MLTILCLLQYAGLFVLTSSPFVALSLHFNYALIINDQAVTTHQLYLDCEFARSDKSITISDLHKHDRFPISGPFYQYGLPLIPASVIACPVKCGTKLHIHSQISTFGPLKFWEVISSHIS